MTEIGEYLLDKFFDGDAENVRSRASRKTSSFRLLVERCETADLPLRRTWLHNAVSLACMKKLLPEGATAFKLLSQSHQTTLLPLRVPAKVEQVAKRAVLKQLSVRDLKVMVRDEVARIPVPEGKRPRRPRKPIILEALDNALKSFTLEGGRRSFTKAHVEELADGQIEKARRSAEALQVSLGKLIEKLQPR